MSEPLDPLATGLISCSSCGWKRIVDHTRSYRGGHTSPEDQSECNEMLSYQLVSSDPPEVYLLGEPDPWEPDLTEIQEGAINDLYDLEGQDVDDALANAS